MMFGLNGVKVDRKGLVKLSEVLGNGWASCLVFIFDGGAISKDCVVNDAMDGASIRR